MLATLLLAIVLQVTPSTPGLKFDYSEKQIQDQGVTHFELSLDGSKWTSIGLATKVPLPALHPEMHTAAVRACNPVECSEPTEIKFLVLFYQLADK
jgi:hypothetical protein